MEPINPKCKIQRLVIAGLQEAEWWFYLDLNRRRRLFKACCYLALKHERTASFKEVSLEDMRAVPGFLEIH